MNIQKSEKHPQMLKKRYYSSLHLHNQKFLVQIDIKQILSRSEKIETY